VKGEAGTGFRRIVLKGLDEPRVAESPAGPAGVVMASGWSESAGVGRVENDCPDLQASTKNRDGPVKRGSRGGLSDEPSSPGP